MNERRGPKSAPQNIAANDTLGTVVDVAGFDFCNILYQVSGAAAGRDISVGLIYGDDPTAYIPAVPVAVSETVGYGLILTVELGAATGIAVRTGSAGWSAGNELDFAIQGFSQGCEG
jgi:D-mannonate dehydratase